MTKKKVQIQDTVDLMISDDYKDRFRAEYWQTKNRYDKLMRMINDFMVGKLGFDPDTPIEILIMQANYMADYLMVLESRAKIEKVRL